jgi:hypothetical protein
LVPAHGGGDYFVRVCRPDEWFWLLIMIGDEPKAAVTKYSKNAPQIGLSLPPSHRWKSPPTLRAPIGLCPSQGI